MKLFHLSDLNIGKRVNEFSMIEDQKYILKRILDLAEEEKPDGIILAGDIYDKSGEICDLHISDHLHALVVKMRVKSGELKRRTIDIRVGNDDLFGIQLRCQVFEIHFFY